MHRIFNTSGGKIVVFFNEMGSKSEEYFALSLFVQNNLILFGQFVGHNSLKPFLSQYHEVQRTKIDRSTNLYTVWWKESFRYKLPLTEGSSKVIIAPSIPACQEILRKLVGITEWEVIEEFFTVRFHSDSVADTGRKALFFEQKYYSDITFVRKREADILEKFKLQPRSPILFTKGGELGAIE